MLTIPIPTVFPSGNRMIQEDKEKLEKQLDEALELGFKITHVTSSSLNNVL
jgi:hypothetical protein